MTKPQITTEWIAEQRERREEWRQIAGFHYEISSIGRVRNSVTKQILKIFSNKSGYPHIGLSKNGKAVWKRIHRLVAEAFIDSPTDKKCINHINGDKADNRVENLEYATHSENLNHAYKAGLRSSSGEKNRNCKLTIEEVRLIKEMVKTHSQVEIARKFGVTASAIWQIKNGKRWANL